MWSPFKAVIFDLDGTLLDTLEDLADSMNSVLAGMGFPPHPIDAYKYFVGDGIVLLVERALPEGHRDEATVAATVQAQRREYGKRWADKSRPYEGVPQLLDKLTERGIPVAILSNKPHDFTGIVVARLLPQWQFAAVIGEGEGTPKKPAATGALRISAQLSLSPEECLYVGDTNTDMQTAAAAGMYAAGALWGFRTAPELLAAGAKTLLAHPLDLLGLL
ncbi:MAG: HAD family hydrolase [Phycisphaerae bacterium]|jgi:phosphoglycolate phosphatase